MTINSVCTWQFLFPEASSPDRSLGSIDPKKAGAFPVSPPLRKSFVQAVSNSCDVSVSQLPRPCLKGDEIAIRIPEEEYQEGLRRCKNNLHGRLILSKGDVPYKFTDLKHKLSLLWKLAGNWSMISLGKGYYEFSFSSSEDLRSVCSMGSWSLKPGLLRMSLWSADFNPHLQRQTHSQCWVRILSLPQEYWSDRIIFAIAAGIGTPIAIDDATNKRTFGHFARVLVDIDLKSELRDKILVEREGYAFFVGIEYENLPSFCFSCQIFGHSYANCRNNPNKDGAVKNNVVKKASSKYIPKSTKNTDADQNLKVDRPDDLLKEDLKLKKGINVDAEEEIPNNTIGVFSPEADRQVLQNGEEDKINEELGSTDPLADNFGKNAHFSGMESEDSDYFSDNSNLKDTPTPVSVHSKATCDLTVSGKNLKTPEITSGPIFVQDLSAFPTVVQNDFKVLSAWLGNQKDASTSKEGEPNNDNAAEDGFTMVKSKSQKKYNLRLKKKPNSRYG